MQNSYNPYNNAALEKKMTDNQYKIQLHICFSQLYPLNFNPPFQISINI